MIVCLDVLGSLKMEDFLLLNSNTAAACRAEALVSCLLIPTPAAMLVTGLEEPVWQVGWWPTTFLIKVTKLTFSP